MAHNRSVLTLTLAITLLSSCLRLVLYAVPAPLLTEDVYSLPAAKVGVEYEYQFQTEGGLAPLTWRVLEGALPPGITLELSGKLRGIPLQAQREPYRFIIEVSDSAQTPQRFSQAFQLLVHAAPLRIVSNPSQLKILPPPAHPPMGSTAGAESAGLSQDAPRVSGAAETKLSESISRAVRPGSLTVSPSAVATASGSGSNGPTVATPSAPNSANPATPPTDESTYTVCGKVRPASMDQTLALVESLIYDPELDQAAVKNIQEMLEKVNESRLPDEVNCAENTSFKRGDQKEALLKLMHFLYQRTEFSKQKPTIRKQIELLSQYIGNVAVHIKEAEGDKSLVATAFTDSDGNYVAYIKGTEVRSYVVSTEGDNYHTERVVTFNKEQNSVRVNIPIEDRPVSLLTRAVVGYQQAGAASSEFEQNYFFDLFTSQSIPVRQEIDPDFGEKWRAWSAIRVASLPQPNKDLTIGELSLGFVKNASGLKVSEAARVFDFLGGVEYRITGNRALLPSFARDTKQKFSLSLIASFGFVTPKASTELPTVFKIVQPIRDLYPRETEGKEFVAFLRSDRDRFFRQYYAGFRFQSFFFNRHNVPLQRFPAQFDITYGVNEYVTGGRVRGGVFRLDGYYPLPFDALKFINLYGMVAFRPIRSQIRQGLLLEPANALTATDPRVALISVPQFNRDYYRVGVGLDFVSFVQTLLNPKPASGK